MKFTEKNKVLLIIHDVYQDHNYFPLGPAYLAAMLKEEGAHVEVYCMDVFHYTNDQLAEKLQECKYDLIGIGFKAPRFRETIIDLCNVVNENKKDSWLVLGGQGPSPIPEYILKTTKADVVAMGEAEDTIVDLLECKINNGSLARVDGIAYREGADDYVNKRRNPVVELDKIPLPEWEVFPIKEYSESVMMFGQEKEELSLAINTSRGCVAHCNFCYRMEKGLRRMSIPRVIEQINILYHKYKMSVFYIIDELFVSSKKRIYELEKALRKSHLRIKFGCDARVNLMDKETIRSLKRCGCNFLCIGFESSDDNVLSLMSKNTTVAQNILALENITEVGGIGIGLNFLWNNLGDTEKTLWKNVDMIKKYNTYDQVRTIRPATAYPGSPLYYKSIEMGLLKGPEDFFCKFKNSDLITVNYTDIPLKRCYELLLEANRDLIYDHYKNTNGTMDEADSLIQQFDDLYNGRIINFRGSRHYNRNESDVEIGKLRK
jgi:radical SAM superfamily enzyme YgiQ (UPF0313 family)